MDQNEVALKYLEDVLLNFYRVQKVTTDILAELTQWRSFGVAPTPEQIRALNPRIIEAMGYLTTSALAGTVFVVTPLPADVSASEREILNALKKRRKEGSGTALLRLSAKIITVLQCDEKQGIDNPSKRLLELIRSFALLRRKIEEWGRPYEDAYMTISEM